MPWPHSRCQSFIPSTPPTVSPGARFLRGGRGPEPGWPVVADGSAERCRSSSSEQSWRAYSSICGGRQRTFFVSVIMHNCRRFPIALPHLYNWFSLCLCDVPCLSWFIHLETQEALKVLTVHLILSTWSLRQPPQTLFQFTWFSFACSLGPGQGLHFPWPYTNILSFCTVSCFPKTPIQD